MNDINLSLIKKYIDKKILTAGMTGKSAYEIAVDHGFEGTESEWIESLSGGGNSATTLAGYGITDAKIENGAIILGNNSITPLTSHQDITGKENSSNKVTSLSSSSTDTQYPSAKCVYDIIGNIETLLSQV